MSTDSRINDGDKPRKKRKGRKRGFNSGAIVRILTSIAKSEPQGRGVWDLTRDPVVNIKDRTTVSRYCSYLATKDWIYKDNKLAPYRLSAKAFGDPQIKAYIFKKKIVESILRLKVPITRPNKFTKITFPRNPERVIEELELFNFSNRIGALITYACMQAISPHKIDIKIGDSEPWKLEEKDIGILGKDKDSFTRYWIRNVINPDLIFEKFCELEIVRRGHAVFSHVPIKTIEAMRHGHFSADVNTEEKEKQVYERYLEVINETHRTHRKSDPKNPEWSRFELDVNNFKKLTSIFNSLYPHLSKRLNKLMNDQDKSIQEERAWRREFSKEH